MIVNNDYADNVLAITDEEVGKDWRLGLLRAMGKVIANSALPADSTSRWGQALAGSNRSHLSYHGPHSDEVRCPIVEVYDIKEDSFDEWDHNSFGDDNKWTRTELKASATCACGRVVRHPVSMTIPVGDLIYEVTNAS
ncbi:MAG: hypothetical protein H9W81_07760 [Enterococcus sp.]|nr:hypothetical protein [Enterococcus sp.]